MIFNAFYYKQVVMMDKEQNKVQIELQVIPEEVERSSIKAQSMIITSPSKETLDKDHSDDNPYNHRAQALSQNILVDRAKKDKIPDFLKLALIQSNNQQREKLKHSRLQNILKNKINQLKNIERCQICETLFKKSNKQAYLCNCEHKFNFCESCLHHYVIYKVKTFEEVYCPRDQCNVLLDSDGQFFKQLPIDIQKKYIKLHKFYANAKNANIKLCPKQNCQGFIGTTPGNFMFCNVCNGQFCIKCLLQNHEGDCDYHQLQFFEGNLHYRQCKKCKFIIEKNQGCNHMTCRCGFQFCYVCGADWQQKHYGNHDQSGQLIVEIGGVNNANNVPHNYDECCDCDCGCSCYCCDCCQQFCNSPIACVLKAPFKLILFILFSLLLIFIAIFRDLVVSTTMVVISILVGIFGFSFVVLSDLKGVFFVLGIIFFPVTIMIGIGMGFSQLFCQVMPLFWQQYCQLAANGFISICEM